jgi:hypothetical protein
VKVLVVVNGPPLKEYSQVAHGAPFNVPTAVSVPLPEQTTMFAIETEGVAPTVTVAFAEFEQPPGAFTVRV